MSRTYFVNILASRSRNLYTGVTNDLQRRMIEHRQGLVPGFTSRYRIFRLVHFGQFGDIRDAIAREKEIKGWRREKKIWLIERQNPTWQDFTEHLAKPKSRSLTAVPARRGRVRDDNGAKARPGGWIRDDRSLH
jgi:putative endonuclease